MAYKIINNIPVWGEPIDDAVKQIAKLIQDAKLSAEEINERLFSDLLSTKGIPDPDLLIRTSGEMRLSNFLLWQCSYTEIYVTEKYWPDFSRDDFLAAIEAYKTRERRFGKANDLYAKDKVHA